MFDNVKCTNCGFIGSVTMGAEECPLCLREGTLAWIEGVEQEDEFPLSGDETRWAFD
jgi:hypothetical protein